MGGMLERLPLLLEEELEVFPLIKKKAANPRFDEKGVCSGMLLLTYRFLGVAEYLVHGDIEAFRKRLSDSARLKLRLFERFDDGEPISRSYVAMLAYKSLFDALAATDFELTIAIADRMGGRPKIEKEYDHPFDRALGYVLRDFVLRDQEKMIVSLENFESVLTGKGNVSFAGFGTMFRAMFENDESGANEGLHLICKGHRRLASGRGVFRDTEDEVLYIWAIGMANLARRDGLAVEGIPPLVPPELLAPIGNFPGTVLPGTVLSYSKTPSGLNEDENGVGN